jgi:hypothetical protein
MIQPEKHNKALWAVQQVIVRARFLASKENQMAKVIGLLDAAEELPQLIADREECTDAFASALQAIAERYPYCRNIYTEFVQETGDATPEPEKELQLV